MPTQLILLIVAMAAIFYLLILRPQQRQKRQRAEMVAALKVGAEVLTVGGIYGTVRTLRDDDFDIEIADGVVMKMDRRAIAAVIGDSDEPAEIEAEPAEADPDGTA